jgi:hypothetical protein
MPIVNEPNAGLIVLIFGTLALSFNRFSFDRSHFPLRNFEREILWDFWIGVRTHKLYLRLSNFR